MEKCRYAFSPRRSSGDDGRMGAAMRPPANALDDEGEGGGEGRPDRKTLTGDSQKAYGLKLESSHLN